MSFIATEDYKEVSLTEGLNLLQLGKASRLYSDGLESEEYIYWDDSKGFCYEDGYAIGRTLDITLHVLISLKWVLYHKFYILKIQ
jgi:hypothetical protein